MTFDKMSLAQDIPDLSQRQTEGAKGELRSKSGACS